MLNIVIPMAGRGSRFLNSKYVKSKPFISVAGKPMIVRVLENLYYENARYILIVRKEHLEEEIETIEYIKNHFNTTFIALSELSEGTASTVLYAQEIINNNSPLLIANSDQIVDIDIKNFINDSLTRDLDGSILTFIDHEKNSKWSFASVDSQGHVVEVKEKEPISDIATVGIYFFRRGSDYIDSANDMIMANDKVLNEFYVCPTYNYAIKNKLNIGTYMIPFSSMHGIGTPEDLELYLNFFKH